VCIWYSLQGYHQMYGHIQCIYMVLANPTYRMLQKKCIAIISTTLLLR
jgi:hypothetical protein